MIRDAWDVHGVVMREVGGSASCGPEPTPGLSVLLHTRKQTRLPLLLHTTKQQPQDRSHKQRMQGGTAYSVQCRAVDKGTSRRRHGVSVLVVDPEQMLQLISERPNHPALSKTLGSGMHCSTVAACMPAWQSVTV